jgi:hypothetical protein
MTLTPIEGGIQIQNSDPVAALHALKKQLEAHLAGVEAHERSLKESNERQQAAAPAKK